MADTSTNMEQQKNDKGSDTVKWRLVHTFLSGKEEHGALFWGVSLRVTQVLCNPDRWVWHADLRLRIVKGPCRHPTKEAAMSACVGWVRANIAKPPAPIDTLARAHRERVGVEDLLRPLRDRRSLDHVRRFAKRDGFRVFFQDPRAMIALRGMDL